MYASNKTKYAICSQGRIPSSTNVHDVFLGALSALTMAVRRMCSTGRICDFHQWPSAVTPRYILIVCCLSLSNKRSRFRGFVKGEGSSFEGYIMHLYILLLSTGTECNLTPTNWLNVICLPYKSLLPPEFMVEAVGLWGVHISKWLLYFSMSWKQKLVSVWNYNKR